MIADLVRSQCLLLLTTSSLVGQQPAGQAVELPNTRAHVISSEKVNDRFSISVGLPASYTRDSTRRFPVVYVLDADKSFGIARDVADWLAWAGEIEPVIIVGVGYENQWWAKRARDMTFSRDRGRLWGNFPTAGGGSAFLDFLQVELTPYIEREYRVDPRRRALAGLSFGGLFAMEALLRAPDLFSSYLIVAPAFAWDSSAIMRREEEAGSRMSRLNARVYTAIGENDDPNVPAAWRAMIDRVRSRRYDGLELMSEILPGESHISSWPVALTRGLKRLYPTSSR